MPLLNEFQSQTTPGAKFALKSPGRKLRNRVDIELCDVRHQQTMVSTEQFSLIPSEVRRDMNLLADFVAKLKPDQMSRLEWLRLKANALNEQVRLAYATEMLESFELPGESLTADELFESGPVEFTDEILDETEALLYLSAEERKNSSQLSTSPEAEAGQTNQENSTAPVASEPATT